MNADPQKRIGKTLILSALGAILVFVVGFQVGHVNGQRSVVPEGEGRVINKGTDKAEDVNFGIFWDVWNMVKDSYVDQPVSETDLLYGALDGLLQGLGDTYSVYFEPEEAEAFNQSINGTFFGIGAEIEARDDHIVVVAPLKNTPASEAGLLAEDTILAVDGVDTFEMTVTEAVSRIRGDLGTTVVLTIERDGVAESFDVSIRRDEITIDSVTWEIRDDGIAYIELTMFNQDTTTLFEQAVQDVLTSDVQGIVLDLRNNPGGLLTEAINVAGFWTGPQTVVVEAVQGGEQEMGPGFASRLDGIPTAVLVNGGSASGAEILAGALQDYGLAEIIGEQTFGKGSVQELRDLADGSAVKLTIAKWLTPNRRSINETGITPDQIVELTLDQFNAQETPQLDAAIRYIKEAR